MNAIDSLKVPRTFTCALLYFSALLSWGLPSCAEDAPPDVCAKPQLYAKFVQRSLARLQQGANREKILDILQWIASSPARVEGTNPFVARGAVRAVFHLAQDDAEIQRRLLEIIRAPDTDSIALSTACRLIVYVADVDGRRELLADVKRRWEEREFNPGLGALVELGDVECLHWLEGMTPPENLNEDLKDHWQRYLNSYTVRLRIQQKPSQLLKYLSSDRDEIDRGWVVRQASRHGATRPEIRRAVMTYLRRVAPNSSALAHASLVIASDECGVFTAEDAREIEAIRAVRQFLDSESQEGTFPAWARLPDVRRAQFYRFER